MNRAMFSAIIKENVQAYRKASSKEKTAILHQEEHHARHRRRHHERQGHQRAQEAVAAAVGVEQEGQRHAEDGAN